MTCWLWRADGNVASGILGAQDAGGPRGNEFSLGVFAFASSCLRHPERLSTAKPSWWIAAATSDSVRGDYTFDRVPLFDYDLSGIEFSIFYEDRARNLWGTPTGFLYRWCSQSPESASMRLSSRRYSSKRDACAGSLLWGFERLVRRRVHSG